MSAGILLAIYKSQVVIKTLFHGSGRKPVNPRFCGINKRWKKIARSSTGVLYRRNSLADDRGTIPCLAVTENRAF